MDNKLNKELALRALLTLKGSNLVTDQQWLTPSEVNDYHDQGSETTKNNENLVDHYYDDKTELNSQDEDKLNELRADVKKQRANDVLKYNKLKELLNKK